MDDSSLKSLVLTAAKINIELKPNFSSKCKLYSAVVDSSIKAVSVKAACTERDAFCQVQNCMSDGSVAIKEGLNEVYIKVDAVDGSSSLVRINIFRPSASDAKLMDIKSEFALQPTFDPVETSYLVNVPPGNGKISFVPVPMNPQSTCELVEGKFDELHTGDTVFKWKVTSSDKTNNQYYQLTVRKESDVQCALCKAAPYCPRLSSKPETCNHIYCRECYRILSDCAVTKDWCYVCKVPCSNSPLIESDQQLETKLDSIRVKCPYVTFGCDQIDLSNQMLGIHVDKCDYKPVNCSECHSETIPKSLVQDGKHKEKCLEDCKSCGKFVPKNEMGLHGAICIAKAVFPPSNKPKLPSEPWESCLVDKKLMNAGIQNNLKKADELVAQYLSAIQVSFSSVAKSQGRDYDRLPVELLDECMKYICTAISVDNEQIVLKNIVGNAALHVYLGNLLEDHFLANLIFPQKDTKNSKSTDNDEACESFMRDEVDGLLLQLAVPPSASDTVKLQAIEGEYQKLKNNGQADKAAEVQDLYNWKLKQMKTIGNNKDSLTSSNSQDGYLKAIEKYRDALLIDPCYFDAHFYLGRAYLNLDNLSNARKHLELALGIKPTHLESRIYLGICYALGKESSNLEQEYAYSSLNHHYLSLSSLGIKGNTEKTLMCNRYTELYHPLAWKSFYAFGYVCKLMGKFKEAETILSSLLELIRNHINLFPMKSPIYSHLITLFLGTQRELLLFPRNHKNATITRRIDIIVPSLLDISECLSNHPSFVSRTATIDVVILGIAQVLCYYYPHCSAFLASLGEYQMKQFDLKNDFKLLKEATSNFKNAITLFESENGEGIEESLKQQTWWPVIDSEFIKLDAIANKAICDTSKDKTSIGKANSKTAAKPGQEKNQASPKPKPVQKQPISPSKNTKSSSEPPKNETLTKTKVSPSKQDEKDVKKEIVKNASSKEATTNVKKCETAKKDTSSKVPLDKKVVSKGPAAAPIKDSKEKSGETTKLIESTKTDPPIKEDAIKSNLKLPNPCPKLVPSKAYLGLARAFLRLKSVDNNQDPEMIIQSYKKVILVNPLEYDSYIELGEFYEKNGKLEEAAETYKRYPFNEEPTQNDLYLHGEITKILMKTKKFNDEQLLKSLIAEGRGMGIRSLAKYIEILDAAGQSKLLMNLYAGVNRKPIDDVTLN